MAATARDSVAVQGLMVQMGGLLSLTLDSALALRRKPHVGELLEQTVFIARVSMLPVVFVTIPLTVVVQFFVGQLLRQIGAADLAGAGAALAVVQELGPFCSVLVVAGAGATAVCADLGARRIR